MNEFEKISNDAWENKDQVNQNSDKNLKNKSTKLLMIQTLEKQEWRKRLMVSGLLINILKKLLC